MKNVFQLFFAFLLLIVACKSDDYLVPIYKLIPVKKGKSFTYIDLQGKVVFDQVFKDATLFRDGMALVQASGANALWGYVNEKGQYIIEPKFKEATLFSEGLAWVVEAGKAPAAINSKGEVQFELKRANKIRCFQGGLAAFSEIDLRGMETWGFVDKNGKVVIEPVFTQVSSFREGKCAVLHEDGVWGFLNQKGETIIDFDFDEATNFINGRAIVTTNSVSGLIDENGRVIIDPQFDKIYFTGTDFLVVKDEKAGVMDASGKMTLELKYDAFWTNNTDDIIPVRQGGAWGYIDREGEIEIPFQFDECFPFNGDVAAVFKDGHYGFIDRSGSLIVQPEYDDIAIDYLLSVNNEFVRDYSRLEYMQVESDYFNAEYFADFLDINNITDFNVSTTFGELISEYNLDEDAFLPFSFMYKAEQRKLNKFVTIDFVFFGTPYEMVWTNQSAGYYSYSLPKNQFNPDKRPDKYLYGLTFRNNKLAKKDWVEIRKILDNRWIENKQGEDFEGSPKSIYRTSDFEIHVSHDSYMVEYILLDQSLED